MVAVDCLASGDGSFESRLYNAWISALVRLDITEKPSELAKEFAKDLPDDLSEDLQWVLGFCRSHHPLGTSYMSEVAELDRSKVADKLIHILIETSRMTD